MGRFKETDVVLGEELFAKGEVSFPLFSGGTYQVGVFSEGGRVALFAIWEGGRALRLLLHLHSV